MGKKVKAKSSDLSFEEYMHWQQGAYLLYDWRSRVHMDKGLIEKYKRWSDEKKAIILDVSARCGLKNIFTDQELKRKHYDEIYEHIGIPIHDELSRDDPRFVRVKYTDLEGNEIKGFMLDSLIKKNEMLIELDTGEKKMLNIYRLRIDHDWLEQRISVNK